MRATGPTRLHWRTRTLGLATRGRSWTTGVARAAHLLAGELGVRAGARVALIAENDPRIFELQFACMRLGAILVPLNWRLNIEELHDICADCEPDLLVHDDGWVAIAQELSTLAGIPRRIAWDHEEAGLVEYEAALRDARPLAPAPAAGDGFSTETCTHILYTSGTTGRPKGALCSHRSLIAQALNLSHSSGVARPGNHLLNPLPLFHAGGLNSLANPILYYGGQVTALRRFDPARVLAGLANEEVTHFSAIPLMYRAIAEEPEFTRVDLGHIRCAAVAGAIAPPETLRAWSDRSCPLQPQYGGTETGPLVLALDPALQEHARAGAVGRPAFHTAVRLVDVEGRDVAIGETGEILLKGPAITTGYWRRDNAEYFTADGWFRPGDAARCDEDGFYYIVGRTKDMYKSGGENVYPAEVENVLATHPAVTDVAVIGVPDAQWDEVGCAIVTLTPGAALTLDELNRYGSARLGRYKLPKSLVVVDELPRNVTGKVNRVALRERFVTQR